MSDLARITAAPSTITIKEIVHRYKPMNFFMIGEFERFAMEKYLDDVELVLAKSKANDDWKQKRRENAAIVAEHLKLNVTAAEDAEAHRVMDSLVRGLAGITFLTWLAVRDEKGIPALADVADALADETIKRRAIRLFNSINGNAPTKKDQGEGAEAVTQDPPTTP